MLHYHLVVVAAVVQVELAVMHLQIILLSMEAVLVV
jgi:hypothetical protein